MPWLFYAFYKPVTYETVNTSFARLKYVVLQKYHMCHLSYFCCGKSIVIYLINLCLIMLNQTLKSLFVCQTKQILMYNCYLCVVYTHTGSPDGQRSGRHTYGKRRFCTLWF